MTDAGRTAKTIFHTALDLSAAERQAYIARACGSDDDLRREVESLLAAHEGAGEFLSAPTTGPACDVQLTGDLHASPATPLLEGPGTSIGHYKLLQPIGEGGFGVVYMAEQQEPVRRKVALKIIKLGMDTKQVIARFEAERQALAMMDHPNIAKVLDAGATETGRPYFVMELVKGVAITEYCDTERLETNQRLDLFVSVCQAVQHAHQKGIIHRDIKPSNVMVMLHDGKPVPKVIDFGIAKATNQRLTEKTLFTEHRQMIGTPEYMSPEQAEMSGLDIDTRSDIYSLGVLLYELLTGTTPFDGKRLRSAALQEIQRIIREEEPPKPSTRLVTLAWAVHTGERDDDDQKSSLEYIASHRKSNPTRLSRELRGDLDWIVMKAMEKDRTRRYESASGLATDIRRHMHDEPVSAGPPSSLYKFRKFALRHRAALVTATLVAAILILCTIISIAFGIRAQKAQVLADRRFEQYSQINTFFLDNVLDAAHPRTPRTHETTVGQLLEDAAATVDSIHDPIVRSAVQHAIGRTFRRIDNAERARPFIQSALDTRLAVLGAENLTTAESMHYLGHVLYELRDKEEARIKYEDALAVRRRLAGERSLEVAETIHNLGTVAFSQGEMDEAEQRFVHAVSLYRSLSDNGDTRLATALSSQARLRMRLRDYTEAVALYQEALDIVMESLGPDHRDTATVMINLGSALARKGELDEAEGYLAEGVRIRREILPEKHRAIGAGLSSLGVLQLERGLHKQSLDSLKEAEAIYENHSGHIHEHVATVRLSLAQCLVSAGRLDEARAVFEDVISIYQAVHEPGHWHIANARRFYGACLLELKEFDLAERELREAVESLIAADHPARAAASARILADMYQDLGRPEDARMWDERAEELAPANDTDEDYDKD